MIEIYNEDCKNTIERFEDNSINIVLTSPPYNNSRTCHSEYCMKTANCRYDSYNDNMTNDEYIEWTVKLFNSMEKKLAKNGVILYNISYGSENPDVMWLTVADIIRRTPFMCADNIIWKKDSALPNNVSSNKLTRITEYVFVFARKDEFDTYIMNKKVSSVVARTGQKFYESIFNFIQAKNNDGPCDLNKATYSSDLCEKLLKLYAMDGMTVYDPFMGTGTTAVACKRLGLNCYGSEISEKQYVYALDRINGTVRTEAGKTYVKGDLF